jgi:hypothetical protein
MLFNQSDRTPGAGPPESESELGTTGAVLLRYLRTHGPDLSVPEMAPLSYV